MKKLYVLVIIVLFIVGCGNNTEKKIFLNSELRRKRLLKDLLKKNYTDMTLFFICIKKFF